MERQLIQILVLPMLLLAVIFGGYTMYWTYLANGLRDGIQEWSAARRKEGYKITFSPIRKSGFPLSVRATFDEPRIGRAHKDLTWAWSGPETTIQMRPWSLSTLAIFTPGDHEISFVHEAEQWTVRGAADRLETDIGLDGSGALASVSFRTEGLAMRESRANSPVAAARAHVRFERFGDEDASSLEPSLALEVNGENIVLPQQAYAPLGPTIKSFDTSATVIGQIWGETTLDDALYRWSQAGGTLEIERLDVNWGSLSWLSSGTVALDEELELIGAVTVQVVGLFETLDQLARARVIQRRVASIAQVILGTLARQTPSGHSLLNVALSLQDKGLYANGIRLVEVPRIPWKQMPSSLLGFNDTPANRPGAGK